MISRLGLVASLDESNIAAFINGGHTAWNEKWSYGHSVMSVVNAFRIGGHTAWNEKWSYGQSVMSVVNAYNAYLGICLSIRLSFFFPCAEGHGSLCQNKCC